MVYKNLIPGQWQIGDLVLGKGTNIKIIDIDVKPYDINDQDYQRSRSDEKNFGQDQFTPTTIEFKMLVLHNRLLPSFEGIIPNFWHSMPTLEDLAYEWRGEDVRHRWGQMKPMYVCSKIDDRPKIIFGRPGQFTPTQNDYMNGGEVVEVLAEFRRGDTFAYSLTESIALLTQASPTITINGTSGKGPSWIRVLLQGPINHPILTFTNMYQQTAPVVIDVNYNVPSNAQIEINAEPWSRRIITVDANPISLSANLTGTTPYLDRLRFNFDSSISISLAGSSMSASTRAFVFWRDAYQVI